MNQPWVYMCSPSHSPLPPPSPPNPSRSPAQVGCMRLASFLKQCIVHKMKHIYIYIYIYICIHMFKHVCIYTYIYIYICVYAAAATKTLQLSLTMCSPIDVSPPGSPIPGILQARTLEWVAVSFSNAWKWKVKVKSFSRVQLFTKPWTAAYQAPLSMGFSRQEYWSVLPLPSPVYMYTYMYIYMYMYVYIYLFKVEFD